MREDPTKSESFLNSEIWGRQKYNEEFLVSPENFEFDSDDPRNQRKFVSNSLSGNERNRMFMKTNGNFADVSLLSGADDLADARSFSLVDFDDDGWVDIALMSLNAPRFKLFKNEFGKIRDGNSVLQIKLVGGNDSKQPSQTLSNRDGIGTTILVTYASGKKGLFQKQAGEGFGSQNSSTIRVGCPSNDSIENLEVRWPSGKQQTIENPSLPKVLTIEEATQ